MIRLKYLKTLFLVAAVGFIAASCNKSFPNPLEANAGTGNSATVINPKTLVIVVDGAVGTQVQVSNPPVLNSLVDYSIFSWDALSDYDNVNVTNTLGWSNLFTGVKVNKHNVTGADFGGNRFADYPSLFTRLKQQRPGMRTTAFFSSNNIAAELAADATKTESFNENDAAVKEAVKAELTSQNPGLVLAQFHDVDKAGAASSYTVGSTGYKNAILQTDAYIGEILTALRSRPSFKTENWMVIITSNKGSNTIYNPAGSWSAFEDTRHNTFFFCFNPRFNSKSLTRPGALIPYTGTAPLYSGAVAQNRRAKVLGGGTAFDIGSTGEMTVSCKVKIPVGNYYYPPILSKRASFTGGVVGWVFFLEANYWMVNFGQTSLGNRQIRGHVIADGQWHTLTVVIRNEGAARNVYTYTDGVLYNTGISAATRDITSYGNLNSPQPLTVGNLPPDNVTGLANYSLTDIKYFNVALPDSYIANTYCTTSIEPSNQYYNNLVGFWPGFPVINDNGVFKMRDLSPFGRDFTLESYSPGSFNDLNANVCPPVSEPVYKTVPNSVDVTVQIYAWFGITVPASWGLDGKNWIPTYSDVSGG
ncbi:DUF4983 domain-containing protein [Lacibacter sediminis]|uniref:DUF4983 domain-containing protein n=1 Tax=Lacibacter sediminis TaxID=2760713 RepID=A0A7G5XJS0_9BACT|nr:DUF4983 domain-containing protein [Lacibacter sediminis]QNA45723.1 DUF4983 domain-containing protein [Lacibacter sediminis]